MTCDAAARAPRRAVAEGVAIDPTEDKMIPERESHLIFRSPMLAAFLLPLVMPARAPDICIGGEVDTYMRRWYLVPRNKEDGNVYLHQVLRPDDDRALHDHPWPSLSIMLSGGMTEITETGSREIVPGDVIFRGEHCRHRLEAPKEDTWTLFITGPVVRDWGFWCPKGFVPWRDFTAGENGELVGAGCGETE